MRIFISSPSDLAAERKIALQVVARLRAEFKHHMDIRPVLWEHEPLLATEHFQEGLVSPSECQVVVCMFWSTLGSALPDRFRRKDGSTGVTGTEWEFQIAKQSFEDTGEPDILVYRKSTQVQRDIHDREGVEAAQSKLQQVDSFFDRNFHNQDSAGTIKNAYWPFDDANKLEEQLYTHLHELLRRHVASKARAGDHAAVTWIAGSPYRGLRSFELEHADIFFGRSRPRNAIVQQLQRRADDQPFLMVTGASGTGKSSLIKAGVLPLLLTPNVLPGVAECRWALFKPSDSPDDLEVGLLRAMVTECALPELLPPDTKLEDLLAHSGSAKHLAESSVFATLRSIKANIGYKENLKVCLLLIIDQFEELFTLAGISESSKTNLISLLASLVNSGHVIVIGTMRSDFYAQCENYPQLVGLMRGDGQFHLGPPAAEEFEQMIRLPARAAGLNFEVNEDGIGLDAVLREAASAHPNILPLLSFTMQELYARRVEENTLCFSAYDKLGGIEGAITRQAHETYEKLPPACQRELAAVLGSLITINADDAETAGARSASWDYIAESPRREQLVQAFVDARLMVVDEDDHDKTRRTVRLAHEALLTRWSKASNWIRENQEFLRARARILDSASYWALEGRAGTLLIPDGKLLDVAADLLVDRGTDLSETVIEYIAASSQASDDRRIRRQARESETKKRRVRFIAAVAGMVVAFGISGVVAYQQSVKDRELAALEVTAAERKAESEARAYVAMAEQELDDRNYLRGATLALSALRNTASIPSSLQIRAQSVLNTALRFKPRSISVGSFANFPSASDVVVTRDDGIAVQRLALDGALESVRLSQDPVFSADGDSFLAVSSDHVLGAWSTSTLTNLVEIEHDVATPIRYGFSDDQSFVYVIDGSGLQLYDASDASAEALAAQLEDEIVDAWIHTHAYAVLATKNGGVSVWHFARNAAKPLPLHLPVFDSSNRIVATMPYQAELETTHALSPSRLLTRSKSGAVKLWNAVTGEQLAHAGNGSLATVQGDFVVADGYVANRWDGNKAWIKTSYLARLPVSSIAVADKDGSVAIVDDGGSLYLWKASGDLVATTRPQYPAVSDERVSLRFDSAGNRLFLDGRGIALLIQLDDNGRLVSERIAFDQPLANNETGKTVYRSTTGELLVTDLESGATTSMALDEDLSFRSIDRAGNRIALTGDGSSVQVWSLDTKERVGQVPFKGALQRASLSASGRLLLVTTDNESRLWDLESTGEEIRFDANTTIAAADYTEPGSLVAVGTGNTLVVVNPSTDVRQSLEFAGPVVQVRFSPDGERLGVGLDGGSVHLFDAKSLETIGVLEHEGTAENLIISPGDGAIVAWSSGSDRVSVWSNASAQSAIPLAHWSPISFVTVDSSYRQLASGTDGGVVDLWDLESGAHLDRHTYGAPIERLYFGERGLVAYVDASQNVTTIVNADLGEPILTMDIAADSIATMAVSFDAESVATLLRNGDIVTWDVNTGRETGRIDTTSVLQEAARELRRARPATRDEAIESTLVQYQDIVGVSASNARLVFAPDGSRLAAQVSKESPLLMFDHVAGTLVAQTDTGLRLAGFDIDSQLLIGTGPDGASYYWSTDDGEPTESHERVQPLLLSAHPWTHRSSARIDTALPFAEALRGGQRLNDADLILDSDAAGRLLIRTRSGRIQLVDPGQKQTVALDLAGDPDIVRFASGGSHIVVIRRSEFTALPAFRGAIEAAGRALLADL